MTENETEIEIVQVIKTQLLTPKVSIRQVAKGGKVFIERGSLIFSDFGQRTMAKTKPVTS